MTVHFLVGEEKRTLNFKQLLILNEICMMSKSIFLLIFVIVAFKIDSMKDRSSMTSANEEEVISYEEERVVTH